MKSKLSLIATAAMLALVLTMVACEDTELTAPTGGTILLVANPANIVIDPNSGATSGTSKITATAFDDGGAKLEGITITFATSGGSISPVSAKTGASGSTPPVTLTVGLNDPDDVEVTALSAALSSTVLIAKTSNSLNQPPLAAIVAVPEVSQLVGRVVAFDGTFSTDPDSDSLTCFQWTIDSDLDTSDEVVQGTAASAFDRTYFTEQILNVSLRVSDDPTLPGPCNDPLQFPLSVNRFSPNVGLLTQYRIECSNPPPTADAGADISQHISQAQLIRLDGTGSFDNETVIDRYKWECGNAKQPNPNATSPVVFCSYSVPQIYVATLTVWDRGDGTIGPNGNFVCQKKAQDTVNVDIFQ